jgi:hypothetical protein
MEKVEPLDAATLDLLALAPPSEIVNRVRADYLVLKLNPAGNNIIVGGGSNARREKWIPILKQRKPDILAHLRGEGDATDDEREGETIIGDVGACEYCGHVLVPAPDDQVENVRLEQLRQSPYWQWTIDELARLKNHLEPGDLIVQRFAHSVVIRNASGRLHNYAKSES